MSMRDHFRAARGYLAERFLMTVHEQPEPGPSIDYDSMPSLLSDPCEQFIGDLYGRCVVCHFGEGEHPERPVLGRIPDEWARMLAEVVATEEGVPASD